MDELENDALSLLMIFDDTLFPQFLEWASSNGWADLVLFMMEVDSLRFRASDATVLPKDKTSLQQSFHLIWKNTNGCFNKVISKDKLESLKRLTESLIPFTAVFSYISELVWIEVLQRCKTISTCSSWPSIRKSIIASQAGEESLTLSSVLADGNNRIYFERFLQSNPADLCCLQCWLSVQRILTNIETSLRPKAESKSVIEDSSVNGKSSGGFMKRWRTSTTAVKSANKTLQGGSGSLLSKDRSGGSNNDKALQSKEYSDPFEAFKVLLEGTRTLQKQFFPASSGSGTTSSGANYVNILALGGGGIAAAKKDAEMDNFIYGGAHAPSIDAHDSPPPPKLSNLFAKHRAVPEVNSNSINCAGLSESLRMEISATLSLNSAVRTRDIETVDEAFAFACANMLEKLLHSLEKETYSHILKVYADFEQSSEFVRMLAHTKAGSLPAVIDYSIKSEFINDRVRHMKRIPWNDSQSNGKLYLFYEEALHNASEDERDSNIMTQRNLEYLDSMGNTSMSNLLAMKGPERALINSFHNGHNPISERADSLADLKKDVSFNTSKTGWLFSNNNSTNNSKQDVTAAADELKMMDEVLFNPDIVAVGLEFYVPEAEPVTTENITLITSHLRVWVGGETKPYTQKQKVATKPKTTKNAKKPLANKAKRVVVDEEYEDSDSSSDEDIDDEILNTNDGDEINYEKLIAASSNRPPRPAKATKDPQAELDLVALDLPLLDANFNAHISKGVTEDRISLKQLIANLVLSLVGSIDDLSNEQRFSYESESSFSFITDSKGLQNLNELIYCHQVHRQGVTEFKESFNRCHQGFLQRAYGPTPSQHFNVSVCIKSSIVDNAEQIKASQLLGNVDELYVAPSNAYVELQNKAMRQKAKFAKYKNKVNVGIAYSLITPKHCMVSLLRNISLQVYYQTIVQNNNNVIDRNADPSNSPPKQAQGALMKDRAVHHISSTDLISLNSKLDMRRMLSVDSYSIEQGDINHNHKALRLISQLDKRVAVCFGVETLYDIYMGARYLNTLPSTLNLKDATNKPTQQLEYEYSFPIMKHLGVCDFSICAVLGSISSRVLIQLLMLLLTDKSVVLLSTNITMMTKLQYIIPRLIWPFSIDSSHAIIQILSQSAFTEFVCRNDPPETPITVPSTPLPEPSAVSSFHAPIKQPVPHHANETSLSRIMNKINSNMNMKLHTPNHSNCPTPTEELRETVPTQAPTLKVKMTSDVTLLSNHSNARRRVIDSTKSLLVCCDSRVYINASAEQRSKLLNGTVKGSNYTIFDLDSCTVVKPPQSGENSPVPSDSSVSTMPKLGNDSLFKCVNFDVMRELLSNITECVDDYNNAVYAQNIAGGSNLTFAELVATSNADLEKVFYLFWSELILRALPRNLNYYHSSKVLSCDIKCMVSELMTNFKSGNASSPEEFMNKSGLYEGMDMELIHFLTVEEFIVYYNNQLDAAANNLLHLFYKEFLLDNSPVFTDLLKRHCKILEYWSF